MGGFFSCSVRVAFPKNQIQYSHKEDTKQPETGLPRMAALCSLFLCKEGDFVDYIESLVCLGYERTCAAQIVEDYIRCGKIDDLAEYIKIKESAKGRL